MQSFELHLPVSGEITALDLLAQNCELSKQQLKVVMHKGAVWLTIGNKTRRIRRAKKLLKEDQTLHLYYNETALSDDFSQPMLLQDCQDYSVWVKPSGMMSQGSKWGDHSTIARVAEATLTPQRPAFIVHRLDRATQGIILIAHTKNAVQRLTALFEQRRIVKKYQAVVMGIFSQEIELIDDIDGRSAYTKAQCIKADIDRGLSLLDIEIGSGRKHQIRRHLSDAGWPIIGDRLYGNEGGDEQSDLQLCAYFLEFKCPITNEQRRFVTTPQLIIMSDLS